MPRAVEVAPRPRVRSAPVRDVRILDRVDVEREAVCVLRPAPLTGRAAAVERRRVVGLDRAVVAAAVVVDEPHPADREPAAVEARGTASPWAGGRPLWG